ncbi:MAG TPA: molybdopterin-dependent oxidoreductase [Anaerolineales bacterium]|nr:molybdopterin-dependent oxidoreductase [Anaerolineales bacterium]
MKRLTVLILILLLASLTACAASNPPAAQEAAADTAPNLVISGGETSKTYSRADLESLPATQAAFKDVTYVGVTVSALLQDAGFDPAQIKAIKAVASDGYTMNYDPGQLAGADIILAYARVDGDLAAEDGSFRLVLPGTEGKLNARMLVELKIIP